MWVESSESRTRLTTVGMEVVEGLTARLAVMIDSEETESAVWMPFTANFDVTGLGPGDGEHTIWVGFKEVADSSEESWLGLEVVIDTTSPTVTIESPTINTALSVPVVQLDAWADEELADVTLELLQADGVLVPYQGIIHRTEYEPGTGEVSACRFRILDIDLLTGPNQVSFHATDLAGNVRELSWQWVLNPALDQTDPVITVLWPQDGEVIAGSSFTLRGTLDDATERFVASIEGGGQTIEVNGLVERNGRFWVEDLPLSDGENDITLTATDYKGNESVSTFTVLRSALDLSINAIDLSDPGVVWATVTGHVGPNRQVVVNGVMAAVQPNGDWSAQDVPVDPGGVAGFHVDAIDTSVPPGSTVSKERSSDAVHERFMGHGHLR